jgi:hypothetical protein
MGIKYALERLSEKILVGIAWHLPKNLVKWCAVRMMVHATVGQYSYCDVSELTAIDVLKRWEV